MMFLVLIALLALFYFSSNRGIYRGYAYAPHAVRQDPLEILKERYARGEIDSDEYSRIRQELSR